MRTHRNSRAEEILSEPATFVQRLPNVFQTSMAFGTRWVVVVQTSLMDVWNTLGSRCTNVADGRLKHVG